MLIEFKGNGACKAAALCEVTLLGKEESPPGKGDGACLSFSLSRSTPCLDSHRESQQQALKAKEHVLQL